MLKDSIFPKHYFSLTFSPGNFECGNPENLKSKCIWVSEAKDHVVVSKLRTAIVITQCLVSYKAINNRY